MTYVQKSCIVMYSAAVASESLRLQDTQGWLTFLFCFPVVDGRRYTTILPFCFHRTHV